MISIKYSRLSWAYYQKHKTVIDNPPMRICISNIENRITFKTKKRYYLEVLMPATMKLPKGTKIR